MNRYIKDGPQTTKSLAWLAVSVVAVLPVLLGQGCPPAGDVEPDPDPVFPADYRSTFTVVRDCRNSIEHGFTVRVWANDVAADAYVNEENPLPEGSIVIKEEYVGTDCSDDAELQQWRVMRKEAPGFDPADADWHWQQVLAPDRRVIDDTKTSCIQCHTDSECLARDYMCTEP